MTRVPSKILRGIDGMLHALIHLIRRHLPPSIRAQMTIFYTGIFAFLLAIILLISYAFTRISAAQQDLGVIGKTADALTQRIAYVAKDRQMCIYPGTSLPGGNGRLHSCDGQPDGPPTAPLVIPPDLSFRLQDAAKTTLYVSPTFPLQYVPNNLTDISLENRISPVTVRTATGVYADVVSYPIEEKSPQPTIFGVLQIARTPAATTTSDRGLSLIFLLSYPLLVVLGGFGSYALATRAFRPIHRMTQAARKMAEGDLRQRVPVPLARDDIHTLANAFNEMAERLDKAFARQRRFVADASHELRTPVAVIRNMTDVALAGEPTREDAITALREVNAEAERLSRLINALLNMARADDGRLTSEREPVRMDHVVTDVAESVAPLAEERGLTLSVIRLDEATVVGDTTQLIQIIMSLVDNALNYTPSGGQINLSVSVVGNEACVAVSDTGIGITPADQAHIFERFYRADAARARATGGSGLGLALASEFARAHGGSITVLSRVGQGSTFTLSLPLGHLANQA